MLKKFLKILAVIFVCILMLAGLVVYWMYNFYNSIFRLSYEQITTSLEAEPVQCTKFVECNLQPGDILIRRYVTHVTDMFDIALNPYFTHVAFYIGNDQIFEAEGNKVTPQDQIVIIKLSTSDWFLPDMHNFVVIRPKNYSGKLDEIILNLKNIADDPEYVFGVLKEGGKKISCSDVILKYLADEKILLETPDKPSIITPDYLFWVTQRNKADFEIVGYSINPK